MNGSQVYQGGDFTQGEFLKHSRVKTLNYCTNSTPDMNSKNSVHFYEKKNINLFKCLIGYVNLNGMTMKTNISETLIFISLGKLDNHGYSCFEHSLRVYEALPLLVLNCKYKLLTTIFKV